MALGIADRRFVIAAWNAGVHIYTIADGLDCSYTAARYYIRELRKTGEVIDRREPYSCWEPEPQDEAA